MALDDPFIIAPIVLVAIIVCAIVIYAMKKRGKKTGEAPRKSENEIGLRGLPFKATKSVQSTDAFQAKDELRILDLEREILSDAIRRLYEAHAEGKISEEERERIGGTYKSRMMTIKESIAKDETIVALHELEGMREDLMKLFSERFGELSSKVDELRSRIDVKSVKEIPVQMPKAQIGISEEETGEEKEIEGKRKRKRKTTEKPSSKTEVEKRIDKIRSEVETVLDKLGQMEIES